MSKNRWLLLLFCSVCVICGCQSRPKLDGSDRDKHGCIPSAGYSWSEVRKDCIQVFDIGVRMDDVLDTNATTSAFLVFFNDSSQVEVFFPKEGRNPILKKNGDKWGNKKFEVKRDSGKLCLYKGSVLIYREGK